MNRDEQEPADSHDLDEEELDDTRLVQTRSTPKKTPSTGWAQSKKVTEEDVVSGLSNEDVWMLIRRFNKQIYYVKAATEAPPEDLDLNRAEDEKFPPEKLRITIERFYTSVIVGVVSLVNHITRLRSWKEFRRTSVFCTGYFLAWLLDLILPTIFSLLVALVVFPPCRSLLFPPVPIVPADSDTDGVKKSRSDETVDSMTGAPERFKGEAAEQEASNLINSIAGVAMESAAGKYGQGISEEAPAESIPSEMMELVSSPVDEQNTTTENGPVEDKTKQPVKKKVMKATDQTMRVISDITDIYEKFANAFSPTPPFATTPRLRLAGILISICLATFLASSYLIVKSSGFVVGFGFFGDPVIQKTLDFLDRRFPNWKDQLDMQKTLLKGVPTNAQLTLTLLRIGEMNSAPLPPPPTSLNKEPSWPMSMRRNKSITAGSSEHNQAVSTDLQRQESKESLATAKPKKRWFSKVFKFVRRTIATAIKGHIAIDRAMAIAGSTHTKHLIGMLQQKGYISAPFGPLKFDAKYERKRGAVVIDSSKEPPLLYFTTYQSAGLDDLQLESRKKGSVLFTIPVNDIQELKKTEGLGWKGKLIVELTAGSKEAADGLVIVGKEPNQSFHLTGMRSRDQLFNRLVAIDAQYWESR